MESFIQGFGIGLGLTIMVGPITLSIIDASLADGWKAGFITGVAMWFSDLLFISAVYFGGKELVDHISLSNANVWVSFSAAAIMISIGLVMWTLRHKAIDLSNTNPSRGHLFGHAVRGFLVNTFSPFTWIFWPTLVAGMVFGGQMSDQDSKILLGSVMLAIVCGDTCKAIFADWIRGRLSEKYMRFTRLAIAIMFIIAGVSMGIKGFGDL